ncbi:polysaccharide deacetylase family protein [Halosimplex amylolyticum]|uniref:polysaccharide deacetylase family protein n=1 Tax=Halosimplex amylolyticum TaxID=3396616 RepID=UPI003F56BE5E
MAAAAEPVQGYSAAFEDHEFALCLSHDVDRPYKGFRSLYYALFERPTYHLRTVLSEENPYWQFESVMAIESDLGVRSAWYFLVEPHLLRERPLAEWFNPEQWVQFMGRYDVTDSDVAAVIGALDDGGWEVGLHGSIPAHSDPDRLHVEKNRVEDTLGHEVVGARQHYLRLDGTRTWRYQRDIGLRYDSSLGTSESYGFRYGYAPLRPFDDDFVVFPLTLMEQALPAVSTNPERAWHICESLLQEAADNRAVMTILWHPRYFNEREFPGYCGLYRRLVERALEMDAWVGPPVELYERLCDTVDISTDENSSQRPLTPS